MCDPHGLQRFIDAQGPMLPQVKAELRAGIKRTHWMWFIFPQIAGLGYSATAQTYAIASMDEAQAYLAHPLLGQRLLECTGLVNQIQGRSARAILGSPDDLKFRSSMTLFAEAAPHQTIFTDALTKYFGGEPDLHTLKLLGPLGKTAPS